MRQRKRISWRLLLVTALIGIGVGGGYYFVMRGQSKPEPFVSLLPTSAADSPTQAPPQAAPAALGEDYPRFSIPTAGISTLIVQLQIVDNSWGVFGLGSNVGHLVGTAPLMGTGNIVLVGHVEMADGSPGVFAGINSLSAGQRIFVNWRGEQREYDVSSVQTTNPDDVSVLYPTDQEQLTLITCSDYDFFRNTYLQRVVVVAPRVT